MIEIIAYWLLIWFNVGMLAQFILCLLDACVNHRWPFHWRDAIHFLKAGLFGFLSMINVIVFLIRFAIHGMDVFEKEDGEDSDEIQLRIEGLTEEEGNKVLAFVKTLTDQRPEKEKEDAK